MTTARLEETNAAASPSDTSSTRPVATDRPWCLNPLSALIVGISQVGSARLKVNQAGRMGGAQEHAPPEPSYSPAWGYELE